jgi:hypothetical protein
MLKGLDTGCPVQEGGGSATVAVAIHVDCIVPPQCQHRIHKGIHQATAQRSVVGDGDGSADRLDTGDGPRSEEAVGVDVQAPTNVGEAGEGQRGQRMRCRRWSSAEGSERILSRSDRKPMATAFVGSDVATATGAEGTGLRIAATEKPAQVDGEGGTVHFKSLYGE